MADPSQLVELLRRRGAMRADDLIEILGTSRRSFFRLLNEAPGDLVRLGRTRATRYALTREVAGIDSRLPVFRVTPSGNVERAGELILLDGGDTWQDPPGQIVSGVPPRIMDMRPQGFLGRGFPDQHPDLGLPERITNWSNDHILIALARRGEDGPGDLILGRESFDRFFARTPEPTDRAEYPVLAESALAEQALGSSPGGERPKFSALVEGRQLMVKFALAGADQLPVRWRDLLAAEHIALKVLARVGGLPVAETRVVDCEGGRFLEVVRFDRVGERGRLPVISLEAVDAIHYGTRSNWSNIAGRLATDRLLSEEDARQVRLLDTFGALIANGDRHNANLLLYPEGGGGYRLAPTFDQLPMNYAPISGVLPRRKYHVAPPTADTLDVYEPARELALHYWREIAAADDLISPNFREIAEENASRTLAGTPGASS